MPSKRIVVINDNAVFLEFMQELLSQEGYETITWPAADTAHAMVAREMPDLVILDIRMERPDSGLMVLELLRLDPKTTEIPVIICSADLSFLRQQVDHLRTLRCDVQEKPFRLDDLLGKVTAFIGPAEVMSQ